MMIDHAMREPAGRRNNRPGLWLLMALRALVLVCVAISGGVAWTFLVPHLRENQQARAAELELIARRDALRQEVADARNRLRWLRFDPGFLEIHARDRLDLHRPGETVVRLRRDAP